ASQGDPRLAFEELVRWTSRLRYLLLGQPDQQVCDPRDLEAMVDVGILQGASWHVAADGLVRILHDADPAELLDRHHAGGAVVERSREDDADHARAGGPRRGPEQGIDGGTVSAFLRAGGQPQRAVVDEEMPARRRDVEMPVRRSLPSFRL